MTQDHVTYQGQCHCGQVQFAITGPPISTAMRCNCSICRRRNAVMSSSYYSPADFQLLSGQDALQIYSFAPHEVNHYFCRHCGIYPFHEGVATPGTFRVNLGCIDEIDLEQLSMRLFDGRDTWRYLD